MRQPMTRFRSTCYESAGWWSMAHRLVLLGGGEPTKIRVRPIGVVLHPLWLGQGLGPGQKDSTIRPEHYAWFGS
jgi:hypothetical protein